MSYTTDRDGMSFSWCNAEGRMVKRLYPNVSCITVDEDGSHHNLKGMSCFDVPLEDHETGNLTGMRLVYELMREAVVDESFDCLSGVLKESIAELAVDRGHPLNASKRGAAVGFMEALQQVFNFAASRVDFTPVFKGLFEAHEIGMADELEDVRRKNAEILSDLAGYPANGGAA